jgi:hypothetical protein
MFFANKKAGPGDCFLSVEVGCTSCYKARLVYML